MQNLIDKKILNNNDLDNLIELTSDMTSHILIRDLLIQLTERRKYRNQNIIHVEWCNKGFDRS